MRFVAPTMVVIVLSCAPIPQAESSGVSNESAPAAPDDGVARTSAEELPATADAAIRAIAESCAKGNGTDCLGLGVSHSNGTHGLPANETRAADMYERACDLGEIRGCNNLAVAFEKGQGRDVDPKRAVELYQRNCDAKQALACRNLGRSYRDGLGMPADRAKAGVAFRAAKTLSENACKAGEAEGCSNLGFMYRGGDEGLPKNEKRAAEYLQRSCDMGYKAVCSRVHSP